ncbi:MAG: hypothetical protein HY062_11785 [Bacteroidetes bacterium]|nr:hypothetical protein [Bacteroidota bacterium]
MKKVISLCLLFALLGFSISCKKKEVDKLTEFDITYSTNLSIPSSSIAVNSPTTSVEFVTPNVPTQQSSTFSAQKTAQSLIDQIKMTKFDVSVSGSGANLDFLKSVTIYIKAATVGEQLVASKSSFPTGATSASLDLNDVNIKDFIFQDNIQFRVVIAFDATATVPNQTLKMDETVHVNAKLLK